MNALATLKWILKAESVFALPHRECFSTLDTDVCEKWIGCLLIQDPLDRSRKPLWYSFRTLYAADQSQGTMHREYLAVVWSIFLQSTYLEGKRSEICTGQDALEWILDLADSIGRLARYTLRLSKFSFEDVHKAGIKNLAVDAFSKLGNRWNRQEITRWRYSWASAVFRPAHGPPTTTRLTICPTDILYVGTVTSQSVGRKVYQEKTSQLQGQSNLYTHGRTSYFGNVPQRTSWRQWMSSHHPDSQKSRVILLLWLWRHSYKYSTNW